MMRRSFFLFLMVKAEVTDVIISLPSVDDLERAAWEHRMHLAAQALKEDLAALGIHVEPEDEDNETFFIRIPIARMQEAHDAVERLHLRMYTLEHTNRMRQKYQEIMKNLSDQG